MYNGCIYSAGMWFRQQLEVVKVEGKQLSSQIGVLSPVCVWYGVVGGDESEYNN